MFILIFEKRHARIHKYECTMLAFAGCVKNRFTNSSLVEGTKCCVSKYNGVQVVSNFHKIMLINCTMM